MRFVAGRGAEAELLLTGNRRHRGLPPGAPWKRVGSGHGNKLRQGKQSAGRDAPSGRCCWQGCRSGRDTAGRGRRRRPWKAGTATSTSKESNLPEGSTIGKTLPAGALQRRAIGKQARKEPPRQAGKEPPRAASEQKRERQNPLS